ncbi:MAG: PEP-CTERM sorting domain-containing protein [Nitrosospira sp.]|nr:PEP-CTERM sorting domain-containing protein [Nitrosospira sp.]
MGTVHASLTPVTTQTALDGLGAISQNTNFDKYGYPGLTYPGSPLTVGDLTFIPGSVNTVGGGGPEYGMARNLISDLYVHGTMVGITGIHDLFAFNAGNFYGTGRANFDITTNLGFYQFVETVALGSSGFQFFGYEASAGEYFTKFHFYGDYAIGVTDLQLGSVGAVPEPETYAMFMAGLGLMGFIARRRKNGQS